MLVDPVLLVFLTLAVMVSVLFLAVRLLKLRRQTAYWQDLAHHDVLTGLLNRRGLPTNCSKPYCLIILDINQFKAINDQYGHLTGDSVLKTLAQALLKTASQGDYCLRWGGDEFIVILLDANELAAKDYLQRLQKQLAIKNHHLPDFELCVGIADSSHTTDINKLIALADQALLAEKKNNAVA